MDGVQGSERYLILAVEESASSVGFYDSVSGREVGRVALSLWPHEIAVSSDGKAYVSNFGVRDYDLSLGFAGNSVSEINIEGRNESRRIYTGSSERPYWAPHGVKLSPDESYLFVNVERVLGIREPDLNKPGSEFTKLLKIDRQTGECVALVDIPLAEFDSRQPSIDRDVTAYDVIPGTHNFVFSPSDPDELWLFSGRGGVSVFSVSKGEITHRMTNFNGAVRSLSFGKSGILLVSATNEVSLVDPVSRSIIKRIGNLGVGQILYSSLTPDEKFILSPAVWEGQVLVIDVGKERIIHRIPTGIDPVQIVISPDERRAYVTHGRTQWLSYVDLRDLSRIAGRIPTRGGPNGVAFAPWSDIPQKKVASFAACLPFTGVHAPEGRELRLGYQHWQDKVNGAGGLTIDGTPHLVEIDYLDTNSLLDEIVLRRLARTLIKHSKPVAMLGSYPSAADRWIGAEAADTGLPFLTGIGRDVLLFDGKNRSAFSLAQPGSCSLEGVILALKQRVSPQPRRLCVLVAERADHIAEGLATIAFARTAGFEVVAPADSGDGLVRHELHQPISQRLVTQIAELAPDGLLVINDQPDAIAVIRACDAASFRPGGIGLVCDVTNPVFKEKLGMLAEGLMGGNGWISSAVDFAEDRFGSGSDFSRGYFDEYSEEASQLAAAGSAVGVTLEAALSCGCASPAALTESLSQLRMDSFYTPITFDERGRNVAHASKAVQLDRQAGEWEHIPIWPPKLAGRGRPRWPL